MVTNDLDIPVYTRYVRIYPLSWNHALVLKLELYGCSTAYGQSNSNLAAAMHDAFSLLNCGLKTLPCVMQNKCACDYIL